MTLIVKDKCSLYILPEQNAAIFIKRVHASNHSHKVFHGYTAFHGEARRSGRLSHVSLSAHLVIDESARSCQVVLSTDGEYPISQFYLHVYCGQTTSETPFSFPRGRPLWTRQWRHTVTFPLLRRPGHARVIAGICEKCLHDRAALGASLDRELRIQLHQIMFCHMSRQTRSEHVTSRFSRGQARLRLSYFLKLMATMSIAPSMLQKSNGQHYMTRGYCTWTERESLGR